jgi:hypothetical protein
LSLLELGREEEALRTIEPYRQKIGFKRDVEFLVGYFEIPTSGNIQKLLR